MKLGIIGGGRAAWAFGRAWRAAGLPLSGISIRPGSPTQVPSLLDLPPAAAEVVAAEADLLLYAVPDEAIAGVSAALLPHLRSGAFRFHASGSLTSAVLGGGPRAFSLHPLAALPPAGSDAPNPPMALVFEGPDSALEPAGTLARALGGRLLRVEASLKPLYHAAAVFGSNHLAAILEIAARILGSVGLPDAESRNSLAALARSALDNWERAVPEARFTGPVARGDRATIAAHLEALSGDPGLLDLYSRLSIELARAVAESAGGSPEMAEIIDFLRNRQLS